jgi:hypothetical protein
VLNMSLVSSAINSPDGTGTFVATGLMDTADWLSPSENPCSGVKEVIRVVLIHILPFGAAGLSSLLFLFFEFESQHRLA